MINEDVIEFFEYLDNQVVEDQSEEEPEYIQEALEFNENYWKYSY